MSMFPKQGSKRLWLAVRMTLAYHGEFPRHKLFGLYWKMAGDMLEYQAGGMNGAGNKADSG
jgi:hypothetical protein